MARVEQVMQPSRNEMFFSRLPVLVEGPEDVAFITTQLHFRGEWDEFRRHGGHFVVCGGKTNMSRPLAIAEGLGIPSYVLFDADFKEEGKQEEQHRRDNACLLRLAGLGENDPWSKDTLWGHRVTMFSSNMLLEVIAAIGEDVWNSAKELAKRKLGVEGKLSKKNALWIAATLECLHEQDVSIPPLDKVCESMLRYAISLSSRAGDPAH